MVPVEFHRYLTHVQAVETRPFSPLHLGPGNEASLALDSGTSTLGQVNDNPGVTTRGLMYPLKTA